MTSNKIVNWTVVPTTLDRHGVAYSLYDIFDFSFIQIHDLTDQKFV